MREIVDKFDGGIFVVLVIIGAISFAPTITTDVKQALIAIALIIVNYRYGSSAGSKSKDATIASFATPAVQPTTPVSSNTTPGSL
jgi:hypothetical protein